jgi:hypothetical protein
MKITIDGVCSAYKSPRKSLVKITAMEKKIPPYGLKLNPAEFGSPVRV